MNCEVSAISGHPATDDLTSFDIVDEIYHNLVAEPGTTPLLAADSSEDGSRQILAWAQQYRSGRVIYDAMGHDRASVKTTSHAQFLQQAARWCAGEVE